MTRSFASRILLRFAQPFLAKLRWTTNWSLPRKLLWTKHTQKFTFVDEFCRRKKSTPENHCDERSTFLKVTITRNKWLNEWSVIWVLLLYHQFTVTNWEICNIKFTLFGNPEPPCNATETLRFIWIWFLRWTISLSSKFDHSRQSSVVSNAKYLTQVEFSRSPFYSRLLSETIKILWRF